MYWTSLFDFLSKIIHFLLILHHCARIKKKKKEKKIISIRKQDVYI